MRVSLPQNTSFKDGVPNGKRRSEGHHHCSRRQHYHSWCWYVDRLYGIPRPHRDYEMIHLVGDIVRFLESRTDETYLIVDRADLGTEEDWVLLDFHDGYTFYCKDEEIILVPESEE